MRPAVHRALVMERDRAGLQALGLRVAERVGLRARLAAVRAWGQSRDVGYTAFRTRKAIEELAEELAPAMLAGHLQGVRRVRLRLEEYGLASPAVRLSTAYEGALELLKARLGVGEDQAEKLRGRYSDVALGVVDGEAASITAKVGEALRDSLAAGEGVRQGVARIRQAFTAAGVVPGANHRLESLFRTQTQLAYSAGRMTSLADPAVDEILWGFEYVTVGDDRVRPAHAEMDGVKRPREDPLWSAWTPPNGYNCRCAVLEVFDRGTATAVPRVTPDRGFDFHPAALVRDLEPIPAVKPPAPRRRTARRQLATARRRR